MKYSDSNKPLYCPMTQSTWYKGTRTQTPVGILWHSTGANNSTLKRYVQPDDNASDKQYWLTKLGKNQYNNDMNHINREMGVNAWIGKLADGTVTTVQVGPWNYRAWGCSSGKKGSCNNGWIQFEICEDNLNDKSYFDKVYNEAVELTAYLCKMYNINPNGSSKCGSTTVPNITCHQESYQYGCGNNHSDVLHWMPKYGKSMATIRQDVAKLLNEQGVDTPVDNTIRPGDLVTIKPGAIWASTGKAVPTWVLNLRWYVKEMSGTKVVIDKSEDGKNSINSPIDLKYLTKVGGNTTPTEPEKPTVTVKTYELVVDCPRYNTVTDAINKVNSVGIYEKGIYYIYSKYPDGLNGMFNISKNSSGTAPGSWINPSENKLPVIIEEKIKVGSLVKVASNAVYYDSGKAVAKWILNVNWIVKSIDGSRVVIDKSEDGKNSINSPIDIKYLTLVNKGQETKPEEDNYYRVRITWSNSASQIGAYATLDAAKKVADENAEAGYKVFDSKGNLVYTPEIKEEPEEPVEPEKVDYCTHTKIVEIPPIAEELIVKVVKGIKEKNPDFNVNIAKSFFDIGPKYEIYPLYAISQSVLETGWFKFTGSSVKPEQHNYCGLGATGGGVSGAAFDTIEQGVEAQYQHLFAYGCKKELPEGTTIYDPRYHLVTRGKAETWEELAGKWAVPGYDKNKFNSLDEAIKVSTLETPETYGHKILNIADRLNEIEVTKEEIDEFYGRTPWIPIEPADPVEPEEPDVPVEPVEPEEPEDPETPDVPDVDDDFKGDNIFIALLKIIWNFIKSLFGIK